MSWCCPVSQRSPCTQCRLGKPSPQEQNPSQQSGCGFWDLFSSWLKQNAAPNNRNYRTHTFSFSSSHTSRLGFFAKISAEELVTAITFPAPPALTSLAAVLLSFHSWILRSEFICSLCRTWQTPPQPVWLLAVELCALGT